MSKTGPIVIIENDQEERDIISQAFANLGFKNRLELFATAREALDFLLHTGEQPFIVISEVAMPGMDGIGLRRKILENDYLKRKSIPFVYLTGDIRTEELQQAYELQVQGYFIKQYSLPELERILRKIMEYWLECVHPFKS